MPQSKLWARTEMESHLRSPVLRVLRRLERRAHGRFALAAAAEARGRRLEDLCIHRESFGLASRGRRLDHSRSSRLAQMGTLRPSGPDCGYLIKAVRR